MTKDNDRTMTTTAFRPSGAALAALVLVAMAAGCQSPPETGTEDIDDEEQAVAAPPSPKVAPLGSLGGPCGKGFASCKDGAAMFKKFSGLSKSKFKLKASNCEGRSVFHTYTMQTSRLVNDHTGSKDNLTIRAHTIEGGYDLFLELLRNGTSVVQYTSDPETTVYIDDFRGGVETALALTDTSLWTKISDLTGKGCSTGSAATRIGLECVSCHLKKYGLGAIVGYISGRWAAGPGAAGRASAAGAVGGMIVSDFWSCDAPCKANECNAEVDRCMDGCGKSRDCLDSCYKEFNDCCKGAGIVKTGGTECMSRQII